MMASHNPRQILAGIDDLKTVPLLARLSAAAMAEFKSLHAEHNRDPSQFAGKWPQLARIYKTRWKLKTLSPSILRANVERYNGTEKKD
jgi:hypothetical protein